LVKSAYYATWTHCDIPMAVPLTLCKLKNLDR
jgi:hypothetical protein